MSAIHQFVAGFTEYDAISNEACIFQGFFRNWGYKSEIFSDAPHISKANSRKAKDIHDAAESISENDLVLLHLSIGSTINDFFAQFLCRKAILYHNMTPAHYFQGIQEELAGKLAWGRKQLHSLNRTSSIVLADSQFNAEELKVAGYQNVCILPLLLDFKAVRRKPDRKTLHMLQDGLVNILFVGRCVPNKRLEDILNAFYYFQKFVEPNSRLICIGSTVGMERYEMILWTLTRNLELENVLFAGTVSAEVLSAYYQAAHVFLCMSEHEGFCIPLLESMIHDVPVLAYATAAVPETLSGAGILFCEKRFDLIAEMIGKLTTNIPFRKAVIQKQRERLQSYEHCDVEAELKNYLLPIMPELK